MANPPTPTPSQVDPVQLRSRVVAIASAVAATAALALLVGCSSGPELTAPVETMLEFEAKWQCDVTRFSFSSTQEIDQKRAELRERFGVSASDHKVFTDMVEDDSDLRANVAAMADETCPAAENEEGS